MSMRWKAHPACRRDLIKGPAKSPNSCMLRHTNGKTNNATTFSFLYHLAVAAFRLAEFLLCRFYYEVSILNVVLPSSGSWSISLAYIGMIAKAKQPQQNRRQHSLSPCVAFPPPPPPTLCAWILQITVTVYNMSNLFALDLVISNINTLSLDAKDSSTENTGLANIQWHV